MSSRGGTAEGGFTLVEMLVAVFISIIMLVALVSVISQASATARSTTNTLQALSEANGALDLMVTDVDALNVTRQPYEYLLAMDEPTPIENTKPMRLMMLTTSAADAAVSSTSGGVYQYPESGLVYAVCYQILYQDPLLSGTFAPPTVSGSNPVFGLYRRVVNSPTTFSSILQNPNGEWGGFWLTHPPQNDSAPNSNVTQDFLAGNVVDFEIGVYLNVETNATPPVITGSAALCNAPHSAPTSTYPTVDVPMQGVQLTGTGAFPIGATAPTGLGMPFGTFTLLPNGYQYIPASIPPPYPTSPAYVELSLTVLDAEGAKLWAASTNRNLITGRTQLSWSAIKTRYGHTLSRRVYIHSPAM